MSIFSKSFDMTPDKGDHVSRNEENISQAELDVSLPGSNKGRSPGNSRVGEGDQFEAKANILDEISESSSTKKH